MPRMFAASRGAKSFCTIGLLRIRRIPHFESSPQYIFIRLEREQTCRPLRLLDALQKVKVPFPADLRCAQYVFDDEDGQSVVTRDYGGPQNALFRENHVIAAFPRKAKSFQFKNTH